MILHLILLSACGQASSSDRPIELIKSAENRLNFATARIEWVAETPHMPDYDLGTAYHTSVFANGDDLVTNHGNGDGCVLPRQVGMPYACMSEQVLRNAQGTWAIRGGGTTGGFLPANTERGDNAWGMIEHHWAMRMAGMSPVLTEGEIDVNPETLCGNRVHAYQTSYHGDTCVVEADIGEGFLVEWELDTTRDFACTRSTLNRDGELLQETITEYEQLGDAWFPMRVSFVNADGSEYRRISVLHASANEPWHPQQLSAKEMFDLIPGTTFTDLSDGSIRRWDGESLISEEAFIQRLQNGFDTTELVERIRDIKHGRFGAYPKTISDEQAGRSMELWEGYVRTFIFKYRLDKEQSKKAWDHLAKCRKPAYEFMKENKERYDKITTDINDRATRRTQSEDDREKDALSEEITELTDHRDRLLEPIQRIFENQLKPGLEKLPTKAQKEQAGANAAATLAKAEEDAKKRSAKYLEMLQQSRRPPQSQPSDK